MRWLVISALVIVAVGSVSAGETAAGRVHAVPDHSAFFNGAGYQDQVRVRVMPTTRNYVHTWHGHHVQPCWNTNVYAYWVPGHYEWVTQQVWVAPTWTTEYVPPVYRYEYYKSRKVQILVREGYYQRVQIPGHYEQRNVQVWVEGYWNYY